MREKIGILLRKIIYKYQLQIDESIEIDRAHRLGYINPNKPTIIHKNNCTNGKICAKVAFPRYTESVKFKSQSRETASKRKPIPRTGH